MVLAKHSVVIVGVFSSFLLFLTASTAESQENPTGFLAFGASNQPDFEGSEDYEVGPFLAARAAFRGVQFELEGVQGRLDISPYQNVGFGPAFNFRFGRDDDVENDQVAALPEIDDATELGAFLRYGQPIGLASGDEGVVRLDILFDVSDVYSGYVAELSAAYTFRPTSRLGLTTGVSTRYVSEDYADTYFSITNEGAVESGLRQFTAGEGFDSVGLNLTATYQLNDRWGLIANASVQNLIGDSADSPIVDDAGSDTQTFAGLGVTYSF